MKILANTIFGSLNGQRPIDWRIIIPHIVLKLVSNMRKTRASFICPFLFHLYLSLELLRGEEMMAYEMVEVMLMYNITSKLKLQVKDKVDFERESLGLEEIE